MKKSILFAAILLSAITAYAAPLDRSIREITDIVNSPQLRRYLPSGERILDIKRVNRGYMLTTNNYQMFVEVLYPLRGAQAGEEGGGSPTLNFNEPTQTSSSSS